MTAQNLLNQLKRSSPSLAFSVSRERDENFCWDGDGPDPIDEGFEPCDVTVTASSIVKGSLREGTNFLGGSYFKLDEPCDDVHGYLPQMLDAALDDLTHSLPIDAPAGLFQEILAAHELITSELRKRWEAQPAAAGIALLNSL